MSTPLSHPNVGSSNYKALNAACQEIRLLEVAPGIAPDIVQCTLKHVSLLAEPPPEYETISYCWGSPTAPSFVQLNGRDVTVPASSEAAIRRMRFADRPRVLWIDVICIDQSSLKERSEQVTLMPTIYRTGQRNLIYLGEDDGGMAERAKESIQCIMSDLRDENPHLVPLLKVFLDGINFRYVPEKESDQGFDFESLKCLFSCSWFTRLWVIQESVLAPTSLCHWGEVHIDLLDVVSAALWSVYRNHYAYTWFRDCAGWCCVIRTVSLHKSLRHFSSGLLDLRHIMIMTSSFDKTEPRDSVYAILGLLDKNNASKNGHTSLLEVNYARSVPDVMRDATRYALIEKKKLFILAWTGTSRNNVAVDDEYATWVMQAGSNREIPVTLPLRGEACKGLKLPSLLADTSRGANVLLLEGFVADCPVETTGSWDRPLSNIGVLRWLLAAKRMTLRLNNQGIAKDLEDRSLTMACTLRAGGGSLQEAPAQPADLAKLRDYLEDLDTERDFSATNESESETKQHIQNLINGVEAPTYCRYRRFFITAEGRMGLGLRRMRAGDLIVIVRGGSHPLVLRKTGDRYLFCGEAYVHGIMNGEAVQTWKDRDEPEDIFPVV